MVRRENKLSRTAVFSSTGKNLYWFARHLGFKKLALFRVGRQESLAELIEPAVGILVARLGVAYVFTEQQELFAKLRKISLKAAQILNDFLGTIFDLHALQP